MRAGSAKAGIHSLGNHGFPPKRVYPHEVPVLTKVGMGAGMTTLGNYSAYQLFHHKEAKITKKILKNVVFFVSLWLIWTMAEYLLNKSWTRVDKFHQHFILHEYQ